MSNKITFSQYFDKIFKNLPIKDQDLILDFQEIYEQHGLSDFTKFKGKIAPSWKGLNLSDSNYHYTKNNHLWHFHVGIPNYKYSKYNDYLTSDYILHFQKFNNNDIHIVDYSAHYVLNVFYLPPSENLK